MMRAALLMAVLAVLAIPACAQFNVQYMDDFDWRIAGPIDPNIGPPWTDWYRVSTAANCGNIVKAPSGESDPVTGDVNIFSYQQVAGTKSAVYKDMRPDNNRDGTFIAGMAKFWVYDPLMGASLTTDTRVGIYSSAGADNIGKILSANITSGSGLTGDANYWRAQWSYTALSMDGAASATGAGYTFTPGAAAPRQQGWTNVTITWQFAEDLKSFHADFYINMDTEAPQANLMLDIDSTTGRWANFHDVVGMYMGAYNVSSSNPGRIDNVTFAGIITPEPSSLLVLGTGLVGLMGMARRRK